LRNESREFQAGHGGHAYGDDALAHFLSLVSGARNYRQKTGARNYDTLYRQMIPAKNKDCKVIS